MHHFSKVDKSNTSHFLLIEAVWSSLANSCFYQSCNFFFFFIIKQTNPLKHTFGEWIQALERHLWYPAVKFFKQKRMYSTPNSLVILWRKSFIKLLEITDTLRACTDVILFSHFFPPKIWQYSFL